MQYLCPGRGSGVDKSFSATGALPLERAVAKVCREGRSTGRTNVRVADMNIDVPVADGQRIKVVANGLPSWHGSQTRSRDGMRTTSRAAEGAIRTLTRARRCRLVSKQAGALVLGQQPSRACSPGSGQPLCLHTAQTAWAARCSQSRPNGHRRARSLFEVQHSREVNGDETVPDLPELLADARAELPVLASRLPARPLQAPAKVCLRVGLTGLTSASDRTPTSQS